MLTGFRALALTALALALAPGCSGDGKDGPERSPEICTDGIDNDLDGFADCSDSDCFVGCIEECTNGIDDDDNNLVDCYDPACFGGLCSEICDDGGDNDADGDVDCLDADCVTECPETCDDGFDNDGDNEVDCDDPDCDSTCDADGDGARSMDFGGDDCDDNDPANYPSNTEVCDGVDNDCDLLIDDADSSVVASTTYFVDDDMDGFGSLPLARCDQPVGTSVMGGDCNDSDGAIHPAATEICNYGIDDDCDGLIDDADDSLDLGSLISWYPDNDNDGWGVPGPTIEQCGQPYGHADNDLDCNDFDPFTLGQEPWLDDGDNDGFGAGTPTPPSCTQPIPGYVRESVGIDCDDSSNSVFPGAAETCGDGIDQDCDGGDLSCVVDNFATVLRGGSGSVDTTAATYDGSEFLLITGNASGTTYCQYTWQAQDWEHSPSASGANPFSISCTDADGNLCDWGFTLVLDGGTTTAGDPVNCALYGFTPVSSFSPLGYGWTDMYLAGGVNLGPSWMYYDSVVSNSWFGIGGGFYDDLTTTFSYSQITDTSASVPP